jgi:filamentous hemagglutinin family protein
MSRLRGLLLGLSLVPIGLAPATAGPNGAAVVGGSATVQGQGTANVVVNQSSPNAIINWQTFNIGSGQTTKILMPSASSTELDRVTGGLGPSQILGSLYSNGKVFLVNPDGILFGAGSRINVGGLLATTSNISNSDFMAGRYNFSIPGNPSASIVNQGSITAQSGGFAALVAPGVRNTGTITAWLGRVGLASANTFALDLYGDRLIQLNVGDSIASQVIDVSTGKPLSSLVSNEGTIKANGGRVELTAVATREVVDSVLNNTGFIEADTVGIHNGMIVLEAATAENTPAGSPTQTVKVSGTLSAAGKRKGTTGGTIVVTGQSVQVSGANINASGGNGGGAVLIGGDWGGGNPNTKLVSNPSTYLQHYAMPNASTVSIDTSTTINASATNMGNGGKVIVWSNQSTTFYGTILAQGGTQSGNGGFVEVSGHQLSFSGTVDTRAPNGVQGMLLLDPLSATISTTPGNEVLTVSSIENALTTGNVIVTTVGTVGSGLGDITVAASLSWANVNTLTLNSYRNITINNGVTIANAGAGNLVLRADATGTGVGTVIFLGSGKVDFSQSTGTVSIFYNPSDNPAGGGVNTTSYTTPLDYGPYVITNGSVPNQLTPYMLVNTVYDLQNIENNLSGNYALGTNIDASATASWSGGVGFVPIGSTANPFVGLFNGQNFSIDQVTSYSSSLNVGFFGVIGVDSLVENVGLTNINMQATSNAAISGALAGVNDGTITNSFVTGSVTTAGAFDVVGGLVGQNFGSINSTHSTAGVAVSNDAHSSVGGLVGANYASIVMSYSTGNINGPEYSVQGVGGFVGFNSGTILQSYATGEVNDALSTLGTGGFAGYNSGLISQSYAMGLVSGASFNGVGGLVGQNQGTIKQSYASGSVEGSVLTANNGAQFDYGSYSFYPSAAYAPGTGGLVGSNTVGIAGSSFAALISGSYAAGNVNGSYNVGGLVGGNFSGTITNSLATGNVSGSGAIGGLVGYSYYFGSITQSYATGEVSGSGSLGGLIGYSDANIISKVYATGTVVGGPNSTVGGLIGLNDDEYSLSSVTYHYGGIDQAYSKGKISAGSTSIVGGLIGNNSAAPNSITNAYWDIQTSNQATSAGGSGLNTSNLTTGLPPGFDTAVWSHTSNINSGYPFLIAAPSQSGLPSGFDSTVWGSNPSINNGYPYLLWQAASAPSSSTIFAPNSGGSPTPTPIPTPAPTLSPNPQPRTPNLMPGQNQMNSIITMSPSTTMSGSTPAVVSLQLTPGLYFTPPPVPSVLDTVMATLDPLVSATKLGYVSSLLDAYELLQSGVRRGPKGIAETGINIFMVDVPTMVVSAIPIVGIPAGMATAYEMSKICNSAQCGPTIYNTIKAYGAQANAPLGELI